MHYLIVGNGVAGITAALTIRARDRHAEITVAGGESDYFFSRTGLMYAFVDRMNPRDLEPYERKSYEAKRIRLMKGWATRLDVERRVVSFDHGRDISYDRLLIAGGSEPNRGAWPGLDLIKDGVVHFVSLQDLANCERLTPSTRQAVVAGGGLIGVELVECLVHHGVEVDFLIREPWYFPAALSREEGVMVAENIRKHGVRLHLEQEIAAVSPDSVGRVARILTAKGLEFPCQMLGVCIGVRPAVDWLKHPEPALALGRGIKVGPDFQTSAPGVWAAGDCAEFTRADGSPLLEQIWYSAKRQGEFAANSMMGDEVAYQPPLYYNSAKFFEIEYTVVGDMRGDSVSSTFFYRVPGHNVSVRLTAKDGLLAGASLLGSRWNHRLFETWIHRRRPVTEVVADLPMAQYDVEFGRAALSGLSAEFERLHGKRAA